MGRGAFVAVLLTLLSAPWAVLSEEVPRPVPTDQACPVTTDEHWTSQEKWVWQRVCVGAAANFNNATGYGGDLDPKKPDNWPESRVLRSAFLEQILLEDKYRNALTRLGARIIGAWFKEKVDLRNAQLRHELWLDRSLLDAGADFGNVRTSQLISVEGSKVHGTLDMNGLRVDQDLFMRDGTEIENMILRGAHIGGQLLLSGSKVTKRLDMDGLLVDQDLHMREGAEFGDVVMIGAHIRGQFSLRAAKITGKLQADRLQVDQDVIMSQKAEFADIDLLGARLGAQLTFSGSKVTGKIDMDRIVVDETAFLGRGAEFGGSISMLFAKFGRLELGGGSFSGDVDMTGSEVSGELHLGSQDEGPAKWLKDSGLILRNAKADAIQDTMESWPDRLELTGFTYRHLGGVGAAAGEKGDGGKDPPKKGSSRTHMGDMAGRTADQYRDWLGKQSDYSPQPYEQLASVLRQQGRGDAADDLLYAAKDEERHASSWSRAAWLFVQKVVIGYGYQVWLALIWMGGLLMLGAGVQRTRPAAKAHSWHQLLHYSFEMLLPVIRLRGQTREFVAGWQDYYFHLHGLLGFVFAAFLAAGLSGLTTR